MQRGRYLNFAALAGALALATGTAVAAATLPPGWTDVTVGKAGAKNAGSTVVTGADLTAPAAVWTMTGVGDDVWAPPDRFDFAYTALPGDGGITARLLTQAGGATGGWAKVGTMLRETVDPSAADSFNAYANGAANILQPSWRQKAGTQSTDNVAGFVTDNPPTAHKVSATAPLWLRTQRHGQIHVFPSAWIKTGSTLWEGPAEGEPCRSTKVEPRCRNVTGGGGQPPKKLPIGTMFRKEREIRESDSSVPQGM
jgi:hypothetical protein